MECRRIARSLASPIILSPRPPLRFDTVHVAFLNSIISMVEGAPIDDALGRVDDKPVVSKPVVSPATTNPARLHNNGPDLQR